MCGRDFGGVVGARKFVWQGICEGEADFRECGADFRECGANFRECGADSRTYATPPPRPDHLVGILIVLRRGTQKWHARRSPPRPHEVQTVDLAFVFIGVRAFLVSTPVDWRLHKPL